MNAQRYVSIWIAVAVILSVANYAEARGGGGHSSSSGSRSVSVHGYTRSDGTHVNSYYRSSPGSRSSVSPGYWSGSPSSSSGTSPEKDSEATPSTVVVPPPPPELWFNSKPSSTAKQYKWQHPWFKTEFSSPNPPPWPYRILSETDGVALVAVAPPNSEESKVTSAPASSVVASQPNKK